MAFGKQGPGKSAVKGRSAEGRATRKATPNARYTPPIPKSAKTSPRWMGVVILVLLGLGVLTVIFNYLGAVPTGTSDWYLVGGLVLILAGLLIATRYR